MRPPFVLALLSSVWSGAALACPASDPVAMVRNMHTTQYDFYVAGGKPSDDLSPELSKLLQRDWKCQEPGEQCAIGADPWIAAQDGSALEPIAYRVLSSDAGHAMVEMRYKFGWTEIAADAVEQTTQVVLTRVDASACWQLDDLRVGTESLRATLSAYEY